MVEAFKTWGTSNPSPWQPPTGIHVNKQTPWVDGAPMVKEPTLDELLLEWDASKKALEVAKETEMELRKKCVAKGYGTNAPEGTNNIELGNGYVLKAVIKYNYKLVAPPEFKGTLLKAIDETMDRMSAISNEGSFIADRIFKYTVDLSKTEYNALVEEASNSPIKQKLLAEVNKVLEIKEAAPTLEIKEPKKKK